MQLLRQKYRKRLFDVAKDMGMSAANLSNIESGRQKPPSDFIERAALAMPLKVGDKRSLKEALARAQVRFSLADMAPDKRERVAVLFSKIQSASEKGLSRFEEMLADYDINSLDLSLSNIGSHRHPLAAPMSFREINKEAEKVRERLSCPATDRINIVDLLEFDLDKVLPGATFSIREKEEMEGVSAAAVPCLQHIFLREDIYNRAAAGARGSAFIIAHELGHLLLHDAISTIPAENADNYQRYYDPEWQATKFAQCLLVPASGLSLHDDQVSVMRRYRVSEDVARFQLKDCRSRQLIS